MKSEESLRILNREHSTSLWRKPPELPRWLFGAIATALGAESTIFASAAAITSALPGGSTSAADTSPGACC
jgi:hypothetical protein